MLQLTAQNEIDIMPGGGSSNSTRLAATLSLRADDVAGINISARKQFVNKKLYQMRVGGGWISGGFEGGVSALMATAS